MGIETKDYEELLELVVDEIPPVFLAGVDLGVGLLDESMPRGRGDGGGVGADATGFSTNVTLAVESLVALHEAHAPHAVRVDLKSGGARAIYVVTIILKAARTTKKWVDCRCVATIINQSLQLMNIR